MLLLILFKIKKRIKLLYNSKSDMIRTVIILSACLLYMGTSFGQINWNINAGGGLSYFNDINFQSIRLGERFLGGPIFLTGTSMSGPLVKETITE